MIYRLYLLFKFLCTFYIAVMFHFMLIHSDSVGCVIVALATMCAALVLSFMLERNFYKGAFQRLIDELMNELTNAANKRKDETK